jgi:DNA-binding MarR family transcriptional regulator
MFQPCSLEQFEAFFFNFFVFQNSLQASYEKAQDKLTVKQWMLLYVVTNATGPHTLTKVGNWLACSRQNVKQIAMSLSKKGYVRLVLKEKNSVNIELTKKYEEYKKRNIKNHEEILQLLFSGFNEYEITTFFNFYQKLDLGIEIIEKHIETIQQQKEAAKAKKNDILHYKQKATGVRIPGGGFLYTSLPLGHPFFKNIPKDRKPQEYIHDTKTKEE